MKKVLLISTLTISMWCLLSQCLIMRSRWSDTKAKRIFKAKNVPIVIKDSILLRSNAKTTNATQIHYAISGSDSLPTLIFVHGSPGSWMHYMKFMWDKRMQAKYRMVSIDRPGFGYSSYGTAMRLREQCELLLPVIQSLNNGKGIYLYGHSYGGPVAAQLAAMQPSLFKKVIIASGAIDVSQEKKENWRRIMHKKPLRYMMPGAFGPSNDELLYLKEDLIPLQQEFAKITCPVHFFHGDKDTWVPFENVNYGKKMMVNAASIKVDTFKGADHQIPWKRMEEHIQLFLKENT
jgi:pimeloyl-ACP methyl ester carboxylesterase